MMSCMELKLLVWFCVISSLWSEQGAVVQVIYITPNSVKVPCPDLSQPCITLSEFASDIANLSQSLELLLLPGEHDLKYTITIINNATYFLMQSYNSTLGVSQITCRVNQTRFQFEHTNKVHINGLRFVGCGNNHAALIADLTIEYSTFLGQNGSGTAMEIYEANVTIVNTTFESNVVGQQVQIGPSSSIYIGGAIVATHSEMIIRDSKFVRNYARHYGGAIFTQWGSNITVVNTNFTENSVCVDSIYCVGGAIHHKNAQQNQHRSRLMIIKSRFGHNSAFNGAAIAILNVDVDIHFSYFGRNYSPLNESYIGDIVNLDGDTHLKTNGSVFHNNSGGTLICGGKSITLTDSQFQSNKCLWGMVRITDTDDARSLTATGCHFSNNSAVKGSLLLVELCSITIHECDFDGNYVIKKDQKLPYGGVMASKDSNITISNTNFTYNKAGDGYGGVLMLYTNVTLIIDTCMFLDNQAQLGGAIAAESQSTLFFRGTNYIIGNHAQYGGGMYVSDNSVLNVNGELVISNNTASDSGGGTYLYKSVMKCELHCTVTYKHNVAINHGGGSYVINSIISIFVDRTSESPSIHFINNSAINGGGVYLALSATIQVLKSGTWFVEPQHSLIFAVNTAKLGGALFVYDELNFDICFLRTQCFLQVLSLVSTFNRINGTDTIQFVGNSASKAGSVLYGGLLDRCAVSKSNVVTSANGGVPVDGITFFKNVTVMSGNKGLLISSDRVKVCLCSNSEPDCMSTPPTIEVRKGENFSIPIVAVHQMNHPYSKSIIYALLNHTESGLGVGQLAQLTSKPCSNLSFSVYSPHPSEEIRLYADGPCKDIGKSVLHLTLLFKECDCPVGFHPRPLVIDDNCVCDCDPHLLPKYITSCNPQTHTLARRGNAWISYLNITNDTNQYSYLTYPYCPLDYCVLPGIDVEINLNIQNGSDVQCQNNRTGLLCGGCRSGLSVSLGTSHCISCVGCHDLWWLILIFITAGVALVVMLLALNITVAVGTINGIIFYANIIGATSSTFFVTSSTKPAYVIVSWLNLDLGFDVCFVNGLDTYMKTWIQMAFPTYIVFLLIILIVWSERSLRLARLIGRKNPVALLATLILLSYAKFLSTIITALLFIKLEFPDGTQKVVWLPDASVDYYSVKHLILVVVAVVILLVGCVFTILLLFWQWIRKWALGKISPKVCHFFDIYQAPYKFKHRYWPGLLLLARVTLYLLFAFNQSGDPGVNLIGIIIVMSSLLLLKGACRCVYKNKVIDSLEVTSLINITLFSAVKLYTLQSGKPETIGTFLSVSVTAALLAIIVSHHTFTAIIIKLWQKCKSKREHNQRDPGIQNRLRVSKMRPLYGSIEANSVTTSVVEFPSTKYSDDEYNAGDKLQNASNSVLEDSCDDADGSKPLLPS